MPRRTRLGAGQASMARERTPEELRQHYLIERELSNRLRTSEQAERRRLYASLYNELFQRVPSHPQLTEKSVRADQPRAVEAEIRLLEPFLEPTTVFLEIGAGDCALSIEIARRVRHAYAIEVSEEIVRGVTPPPNLTLLITDGLDFPIPDAMVALAYSNQVMEHLHPDDAIQQLTGIYRCLMPGGSYICLTPNRLTGPHDISKYFDDVATGFHLKEYTASELAQLFGRAGFHRHRVHVGGRGVYLRVPVRAVWVFEVLAKLLPLRLRRLVMKTPLRGFLGIGVVTEKPTDAARS